jgi:hypothetical protein
LLGQINRVCQALVKQASTMNTPCDRVALRCVSLGDRALFEAALQIANAAPEGHCELSAIGSVLHN